MDGNDLKKMTCSFPVWDAFTANPQSTAEKRIAHTDWLNADVSDVKKHALDYYSQKLKREISLAEDLLFSIAPNSKFQITPILANGKPAVLAVEKKSGEGASAFVLAGGTIFAVGARFNMMKTGLPWGNILIQGAIGSGMILAIHEGVEFLHPPKKVMPLADVSGFVGTLKLMDLGSKGLAKIGILKSGMFPDGIGLAHLAQAMPMFAVSGLAVSSGFNELGCKFGTRCNEIGSLFTTMIGYTALSQTTTLMTRAIEPSVEFATKFPQLVTFAESNPAIAGAFARLGAAYGSTIGTRLVPAAIGCGDGAITLSLPGALGFGGIGGGVYLASDGLAGGSGVLGGTLQGIGAAGVVMFGSWIGGSIVDAYDWASDNTKDHDYDLVDFTWKYMNMNAGGIIAGLFNPLIKGIQALTISDEVYKDMQFFWGRWADGCNNWVNSMSEKFILPLALSTMKINPSNGKPEIDYSSIGYALIKMYGDAQVSDKCNGEHCVSNADSVKSIYSMIDRFINSSQKHRLSDEAILFRQAVSKDGRIVDKGAFKSFLKIVISKYAKNGVLYNAVRKEYKRVNLRFLEKLVSLGLAKKDDSGKIIATRVDYKNLDDEQAAFIFGGKAVYMAFISGEIKDASDIQSPYFAMRRRVKMLKHTMEISLPYKFNSNVLMSIL